MPKDCVIGSPNFKKDAELECAIDLSFKMLYQKDKYLISHKPYDISEEDVNNSEHICERSIVFRYAHYLQNCLDSIPKYWDLSVDCEYNRNLDRPKGSEFSDFKNGVYPDLILHKRGCNKANILVMEFKAYWSKDKDGEKDRNKITEFVRKGNGDTYKYKYGAFVLIKEDAPIVTWYGFDKIYEETIDIE